MEESVTRRSNLSLTSTTMVSPVTASTQIPLNDDDAVPEEELPLDRIPGGAGGKLADELGAGLNIPICCFLALPSAVLRSEPHSDPSPVTAFWQSLKDHSASGHKPMERIIFDRSPLLSCFSATSALVLCCE